MGDGEGTKKVRDSGKSCTFLSCQQSSISFQRSSISFQRSEEGDGAVDEVGKGLAFELAGSQEGDVDELMETFVFAG